MVLVCYHLRKLLYPHVVIAVPGNMRNRGQKDHTKCHVMSRPRLKFVCSQVMCHLLAEEKDTDHGKLISYLC